MKIVQWVKAHPWTTGAVVVGAGVTFFLVRSMTGGSSTVVAAPSSGPSEDAQLAFAGLQLQGQIASQQASAAVQQATIEGDVAKTIATLQAQAALAQIDAQRDVSLADIGASKDMFTLQNQAARDVAQMNAALQAQSIQAQTSLQQQSIQSNENIFTKVIDALKPAPPPAPSPPPPPPPPAPAVATLQDYMNANPDIPAYFSSHQSSKDKKEYAKLGIYDVASYTQWHIANFGTAGRSDAPGTVLH